MKPSLLSCCMAIVITVLPLTSFALPIHFHLVRIITLPTKDGHGDLLRYDPGNQKIYASMAYSAGAVINSETNNIDRIIRGGIENPSGMAWDKKYIYWTSNGKVDGHPHDQVYVISKRTWKIVYRFRPVGLTPDAIYADSKNQRLYITMDDSNWIDIYHFGEKPRYLGKIILYPSSGSGPDVGTLLAAQDRLYVPDDSWEEIVDLKNHKIVNKVNMDLPTVDGKPSHTKGQVYDEKTGDLWVGTTNSGMLVFHGDDLKLIKRISSRSGIDEVAIDPGYQLIYAFESKGRGFDVYNAVTLQPIAFVKTGYLSTHRGAVNPRSHEVYAYAGMDHAIFVYKP